MVAAIFFVVIVYTYKTLRTSLIYSPLYIHYIHHDDDRLKIEEDDDDEKKRQNKMYGNGGGVCVCVLWTLTICCSYNKEKNH